MTKAASKRKAHEIIEILDDNIDIMSVDSSPDDPVEQINSNGEYEHQTSSKVCSGLATLLHNSTDMMLSAAAQS
jgi:hypothetical protein